MSEAPDGWLPVYYYREDAGEPLGHDTLGNLLLGHEEGVTSVEPIAWYDPSEATFDEEDDE